MGFFDKKPGRPTNGEKFVQGLTSGVVRGAVESNSFSNTVNKSVRDHTGKDFGNYAGDAVRNIASRIK